MTDFMPGPSSADANADFDADARGAAYLAGLAAHVDNPEWGEHCREILNEDPQTQRACFELSKTMAAGAASILPLSVLVTARAAAVCGPDKVRSPLGRTSRERDRRGGRVLRRRAGGRLARLREDRGSATAWAIGVVVVVALLSGAVLDGGNAMAARVQALDIAQQAARAGANQLDLAALRNDGMVRLNPAAAQAAAEQFLRQSGVPGAATATPAQVSVTVNRVQPTLLLDAIGVSSISMTATATAVPATTA